jgi:hypothetical protein
MMVCGMADIWEIVTENVPELLERMKGILLGRKKLELEDLVPD